MKRVALCFLLLFPVAAFAQVHDPSPASTDPMVRAREVYDVGVNAYNQQFYSDAETAFREVFDLIHSPEVLFDIALCQEKQRKWGAAAQTYETYLRDSHKVKDRKRIEARIAELHGRQQRQDELDAALHSGKPAPHDVATSPGNEVMKMGEVEDGLLGFGEATGGDEKPAIDVNRNDHQVDTGGTPVYKKWWLWTIVAVVAVAAAVTIAVVATSGGSPEMTTFPDIGPGAKGLLLRF